MGAILLLAGVLISLMKTVQVVLLIPAREALVFLGKVPCKGTSGMDARGAVGH